jgi:hypothetical protein
MSTERDLKASNVSLFIPRPRNPLGETLRRYLLPEPPSRDRLDVEALCTSLREVAVWTSRCGAWQENASFLLTDVDGGRRLVAFGDAGAGALIARLRLLPGFDTDRLLDLIGSQSEEIAVLWRAPVAEPV